jgi:hypothetical protein
VSLWILWAAELTLRSLLWTVRNGRLYVVVGEAAVLRFAIAKAFDWSAAIILKRFGQFERRMAGSEQFVRWCQVQWIVALIVTASKNAEAAMAKKHIRRWSESKVATCDWRFELGNHNRQEVTLHYA